MFYYMYQIRNNLNEKIYVGVHQTTNLNDGYMGSGKVIQRALEKHGVENFTKVILETFENAEAMYVREKEVVNDEFLSRSDVYNILRGGHGGFNYLNDSSEEHKQRAKKGYESALKSGLLSYSDERRAEAGIKSKNLHKKRKVGFTKPEVQNEMRQRANSAEAKQKRKTTMMERGHAKLEKNSQFGKCWISHIVIGSKTCKAELLPEMIEQGWVKGRNKFKSII